MLSCKEIRLGFEFVAVIQHLQAYAVLALIALLIVGTNALFSCDRSGTVDKRSNAGSMALKGKAMLEERNPLELAEVDSSSPHVAPDASGFRSLGGQGVSLSDESSASLRPKRELFKLTIGAIRADDQLTKPGPKTQAEWAAHRERYISMARYFTDCDLDILICGPVYTDPSDKNGSTFNGTYSRFAMLRARINSYSCANMLVVVAGIPFVIFFRPESLQGTPTIQSNLIKIKGRHASGYQWIAVKPPRAISDLSIDSDPMLSSIVTRVLIDFDKLPGLPVHKSDIENIKNLIRCPSFLKGKGTSVQPSGIDVASAPCYITKKFLGLYDVVQTPDSIADLASMVRSHKNTFGRQLVSAVDLREREGR